MKYLPGILLCLLVPGGIAVAQQNGELAKSTSEAPSGIQPSSQVLVRALLAADKAAGPPEEPSIETLKEIIEREIIKSVSLPFAIPAGGSQAQSPGFERIFAAPVPDPLVVIDGAVYFKFGGTVYPMNGGGASGCFDSEAPIKLRQARAKFAAQNKATANKD